MEALFNVIADIQFRHQYYQSLQCTDFDIVPSAETQRILSNNRLVFRARPDGCRIIQEYRKTANGTEALLPLLPPLKLSFFIKLKTPLFFNFTDIPFANPFSEVFYFTNYGSLPVDETRTLTAGENASQQDLVTLTNDSIPFQPVAGENFIQVEDIHGTYLYEEKYIHTTQSVSPQIRTSSFSAGLYTLLINGENKSLVYYTRSQPGSIFGVMELFLDFQHVDFFQNERKSLKYVVSFNARATRWKYLLRLKNNITNHLEIHDETQQHQFLLDEVLSSGEEKHFISVKAIPFNEAYDYVFILASVNPLSGAKTVLMERLPFASPENIIKDKHTSFQFLSTIRLQL